jgi:hypothetical protein
VTKRAPPFLEDDVLHRTEQHDQRRHRQAQLTVRERVDDHLFVTGDPEAEQRMPDIVRLAKPPHQVRHVRIVDVTRGRRLVVGGDAVIVEVPHIRAAKRRRRQRTQRRIVDVFARELGPLAQEALAFGRAFHLRLNRPESGPARDLFDAVDFMRLRRIRHHPNDRLPYPVPVFDQRWRVHAR